MSIEVDTKDCTALSDAELADMADICTDGSAGFDVGFLSKQRDEWVLVTQAREGGRLAGFSFCTLERIGGTPSLLVGLASVKPTSKREQVVRALMNDQYRRALLAFPDMQIWSDICDIQNRKLRLCTPPEPICTIVANAEHPVTAGLDDWEMKDEIYLMDTPTQASQILLKTNHPESMPALAWAHRYRNAQVLCYQAGHDARAFTNPNFQALLARGIEWLARRR